MVVLIFTICYHSTNVDQYYGLLTFLCTWVKLKMFIKVSFIIIYGDVNIGRVVSCSIIRNIVVYQASKHLCVTAYSHCVIT